MRLRELAGYIAPTTLIGTLLLYFGYAGTRARFEYFGVSLDLLDMSTQDLSLQGLEVVYVPAVLVALLALAAIVAHAAVSWTLSRPGGEFLALVAAGLAALIGLLLLARGLLGVLQPDIAREEDPPGQTPLALAIGPALLTYGIRIALRLAPGGADGAIGRWYASRPVRTLRLGALTAVAALAVGGSFWAADSFARAYGTGRAFEDARHLSERPAVVLDTVRPLPARETGPGVTERRLERRAGDPYRFRYGGLRLLAESGDRLFLVPAQWRRGSGTLVLPYDDTVRLRLVPGPP
ncbi:MAG: hypothetical protein GEV11_04710 [Streptosporangiales bacterium]|nr:hypothetical protein [Streptosporangiales bacterium]